MRSSIPSLLPVRLKPLCIILALVLFPLTGCGGGGGGESSPEGRVGGSDSADFNCDGACDNQSLSTADVEKILRQGIAAAQGLGVAATFSILDRVGNVLAVYQMEGASGTTTISGDLGATGGLEGLTVPSTVASISKAGTGAYLSSQGNAFSTRTASQIIQEHFDPLERNAPGGPLFGVQFSQLICSDVTVLNPQFGAGIPAGNKALSTGMTGPRPLPLGLAGDPGGIPLYKLGDVVGGLGVELDGVYRIDRFIQDYDNDIEERIALSASTSFEAPGERVADQMYVAGKALRYTDLDYSELDPLPAELPELNPAALVSVTLFTDGQIRSGAVFGDPSSGIAETVRAGVPAAILVDAGGNNRFPPQNGSPLGGIELQAVEVDSLLDSALVTSFRARAAIRRPLDTGARVSIWVVDHLGIPRGFVRTQDAPVFGIDVALQKARTAAFFSSADAGAALDQIRAQNGFGAFDDYVTPTRQVLGATALTGANAITARAIGNLARPFFADGIDGNQPGALSLPFPGLGTGRTWSPFNTGLQLDLIFQRLAQPLGLPVSPPSSIPDTCTDSSVVGRRLGNGIQIFPGAVPLYRGGTLIGAIGISGDGIDQDDMVAFYGASRQGLDFAGRTGVGDAEYGFNSPREIRSDRIPIDDGLRLRYVNCPEGPFSGSNDQNVCEGF